MASIEALAAIRQGASAWAIYIRNHSGAIDLSNANLRDFDLRGFQFPSCSFVASDLHHVNLDGARLTDCDLTACDLSDSSLVDCVIAGSVISDTTLHRSVMRRVTVRTSSIAGVDASELYMGDSRLDDCTLINVELVNSQLERLVITQCRLNNIRGADLTLTNHRVSDSDLINIRLLRSVIEQCDYRGSSLEKWSLNGGRLDDVAILDCRVNSLAITQAVTNSLDLSRSTIINTDLKGINLATAVLLDTAIVKCTWPEQRSRVTVLGSLVLSPDLPGQPVQDFKGVPPSLRRIIADAQYLRHLEVGTDSRVRRAFFRMWGATSKYGQSATRLLAWSIGAILLNVLLMLAIRSELFGPIGAFDWKLLANSAYESAQVFFGITPARTTHGFWEAIIRSLTRIEGFLALGIWVSIATQKVTRLSGE